ncbi:MAG: hypothetical protein ACLP01_27405 [Solirubrobacteraceae bacterium]
MTRMLPRLALVATSVLALGGFAASSALAQATPTVTLASQLTAESAVLTGTIDTTTTAGSSVCYSFEYDTVADYIGDQNNIMSTDDVCVPSGSGVITVSSPVGCYPQVTCTGDNLPLTPGFEYQYILSAQYEPGTVAATAYATAEQLNSLELTFATTPLGTVSISSRTLAVKSNGKTSISIVSNSQQAAQGIWALTVKSKGKTIKALSGNLNIAAARAGSKRTKVYTGTLSSKVRSLLAKASKNKLSAQLTITLTSDQNLAVKNPVTLALTK